MTAPVAIDRREMMKARASAASTVRVIEIAIGIPEHESLLKKRGERRQGLKKGTWRKLNK